ncbi:MAG: hypothetical protein LBE92_07225 [Chryseobacterium sp.]|jgi:hypothetical protein|uniref:XAC2610-related protein n=1 Tax=Chryseobacterium sp. TaxID=1871047 RepID=UPI002829D73B|nr:hypothetical protein [Chryseobacterium sp.]MDR2235899.1 hypothetical protein [Chryseobacterium sp.]
MMRRTLLSVLVLAFGSMSAQTVYTGSIGDYPVEMIIDSFSKTADGLYVYTNFDEPIELSEGTVNNGTLIFHEKETTGKKATKAILTFNGFTENADALSGIWKNVKTGNELNISLTKKYSIENGENIQWKDRELLQSVSIGNSYFKAVVSKENGSYYPTVTSIKIFEKKTDRLLQELEVSCQLLGLNNITVNDYNFDGIDDFSVFESSYAGPNTSSIYFLFDPKTRKYSESSFSGISLEFDPTKKRVYERNQCCAGTVVTTVEYKVVSNSLVQLAEHCYRWNEKKQKLQEKPMKECQ